MRLWLRCIFVNCCAYLKLTHISSLSGHLQPRGGGNKDCWNGTVHDWLFCRGFHQRRDTWPHLRFSQVNNVYLWNTPTKKNYFVNKTSHGSWFYSFSCVIIIRFSNQMQSWLILGSPICLRLGQGPGAFSLWQSLVSLVRTLSSLWSFIRLKIRLVPRGNNYFAHIRLQLPRSLLPDPGLRQREAGRQQTTC